MALALGSLSFESLALGGGRKPAAKRAAPAAKRAAPAAKRVAPAAVAPAAVAPAVGFSLSPQSIAALKNIQKNITDAPTKRAASLAQCGNLIASINGTLKDSAGNFIVPKGKITEPDKTTLKSLYNPAMDTLWKIINQLRENKTRFLPWRWQSINDEISSLQTILNPSLTEQQLITALQHYNELQEIKTHVEGDGYGTRIKRFCIDEHPTATYTVAGILAVLALTKSGAIYHPIKAAEWALGKPFKIAYNALEWALAANVDWTDKINVVAPNANAAAKAAAIIAPVANAAAPQAPIR